MDAKLDALELESFAVQCRCEQTVLVFGKVPARCGFMVEMTAGWWVCPHA